MSSFCLAIFLDDQLNILPISSHVKTLEKLPPGNNAIDSLLKKSCEGF